MRSNELGWMRVVLHPLGWALAFLGELGDVMGERGGAYWLKVLEKGAGEPQREATSGGRRCRRQRARSPGLLLLQTWRQPLGFCSRNL